MRPLATAFALFCASTAVPAQDPGAARTFYTASALAGEQVELPFVRWDQGILVEDVMVNGKGPFRFLLDTGAEGGGRVDRSLAETLGLTTAGDAAGVGPLGGRAATRHRLDSLALGGLSFTGVEVLSRDYNAERERGFRPIDGILGYHLFREYLLRIDYPARTLTISKGELPAPDGKTVLAIVSSDGDPEIDVIIGGHAARALLDTGAMLTLAVPAALGGELAYDGEPKVLQRHGDLVIRSAQLAGALRVGDLEFAGPRVILGGRIPEANLGMGILAALDVTFDQRNGRVRVARPAPRPEYGVELAMRADGSGPAREIRVLTAGGIAAAAGLRASDRVVSLDGRAVLEMDREEYLKHCDAKALRLEIEREGKTQELLLSLE